MVTSTWGKIRVQVFERAKSYLALSRGGGGKGRSSKKEQRRASAHPQSMVVFEQPKRKKWELSP